MPATKHKYYDELNIFRALVIIWVVIGHSFNKGHDVLGFLHYYAYTFHMSAFFILSGMLFSNKVKAIDSFKKGCLTVVDRFKRLIVPYLFFTAVSFLLKFFLEEYANNELTEHPLMAILSGNGNPNGGIWFLHTLFVMSCLAVLLCKVPSLITFFVMLGLKVAMLFVKLPDFGIAPLSQIYKYGVFFFFGIFIFRYYDKLSESITKRFRSQRVFTAVATIILLAVSFCSIRWVQLNGVPFKGANYLLTAANILVWYFTAVWCACCAPVKRVLTPVGNYGMDIYMIGYYVQITLRVVLMSMLDLPYLFYSMMMCIGGLLLPIPISKYIVRRFRITRALMLGNFSKQTNNKEVSENGKEA